MSSSIDNWFDNGAEVNSPDNKKQELDPITRMFNQLEKERKDFGFKIKNLSTRLANSKGHSLVMLMSDIVTERQICLERKHELLNDVSKFSKKKNERYAIRLKYYLNDYDRKTTTGERDILILSDISQITYIANLIEDQTDYFHEMIKELDHMLFGIKHIVSLLDYTTPVK